mgnify:CR=1 FL=1
MSNSLIQVRIDDKLKENSQDICEELGIDLSTAIRMFLKRMVAENGLPFSTNLDVINLKKQSITFSEKEK